MEYLIISAIAFGVGWWVREQTMILNLLKNPDMIIKMMEEIKRLRAEAQDITDGKALPGLELEVEESSGQVYAWVKSTNQFIGQGSNIEEVIKMAKQKFPDCNFWYKKQEENNQSA